MKNLFRVLLTVLIMTVMVANAENIIVSLVIGQAVYKNSDSGKWLKVKPNMVLMQEGTIQTRQASKIKIRFTESSVEMLIPENKILKIADIVEKKNSIVKNDKKLKLNMLKARLNKDSGNTKGSAVAVAGVRGSKKGSAPIQKTTDLVWDE